MAQHPRILVQNNQKEEIIKKIEANYWAKFIHLTTVHDLAPYIKRHKTDPNWILDRYLMNRIPGKRYTHCYSADGTEITRYEGDAPVPTVRVSPHKRSPVTPEGGSYRMPRIDELIPNDTSTTMSLFNLNRKCIERVDPKSFVGNINSKINELAFKASFLYWLTGDESYAQFSSDILYQWAQGAQHQEPIIGAPRTGFLNVQTLGDESSKSLIFAYDFLYPYLKKRYGDLTVFETVFEKIAHTLAFRGYVHNNWYAAESSTMIAAALALSDTKKREYYIDFFLKKDNNIDGFGQLALPSTIKTWLTEDGHWREPGGYHNYPVSKLLESSLMLENNGYAVFSKFPALFDASFAMLKYAFPNLSVPAYGDTGRSKQSTYCLEVGILMAKKYNMPILNEMMQAMQLIIKQDDYKREFSGIAGLLSYVPLLPTTEESSFNFPRSAALDFSSFYLQRNGMDPMNGLMYYVQGDTYNHNHANGMAMELYGKGDVMGIDPGCGPNYEHPLHVGYYAVWAAHNTVVAAGRSNSTPVFKGSGGTKSIGGIKLRAMEPLPETQAVSPQYSFTDTEYLEPSTQTNQQRAMAIIRNSAASGFYIDIFRSDNPISNDYLYHNIGDQVDWFDSKNRPIPQHPTDYPLAAESDLAGFRFFKSVKTVGNYPDALTARFTVKSMPKSLQFTKNWVSASKRKPYIRQNRPNNAENFSVNDKSTPPLKVYSLVDSSLVSSRFIKSLDPKDNYPDEQQKLFKATSEPELTRYMQVWMPASNNKRYFSAFAPASKTASAPYSTMPAPVITARVEGEAWSDPFVAIYEPYTDDKSQTILSVEKELLKGNGQSILIRLVCKEDKHYTIFNSINPQDERCGELSWHAVFGIASYTASDLTSLYLGNGKFIKTDHYALISNSDQGSASAYFDGDHITINSTTPISFVIQDPKVKAVHYSLNGTIHRVKKNRRGEINITLPKLKDLVLTVLLHEN
jgi:hypothetical protein